MKKIFILLMLLFSLFIIVALCDCIAPEDEDELSKFIREEIANELEPEETIIGSLIHRW